MVTQGVLSEQNLLTVLGVSSISAAMAALHDKCIDNDFNKLALGQYLDLPNFTVDGTNYGTQRIVIAGFNTYKKLNGYNPSNNILFIFKNIVLTKQMNNSNTNDGGYHASILRPFVDETFKTGLINSIGNCIYPVNRYLSDKGTFSWHRYGVWLPTEYEVFGGFTFSETQSEHLVTIPLYTQHADYRKKNNYWWLSSPIIFIYNSFCSVYTSGSASINDNATDSSGVSPCFCIS
jgi:hypothetical protein